MRIFSTLKAFSILEITICFWIFSFWAIYLSNFLMFMLQYSSNFNNRVEFYYIAQNVLECYAWRQDMDDCNLLLKSNLFGNLAKFSNYVVEEQLAKVGSYNTSSMHWFKFRWEKTPYIIEIVLPSV